MCLPLAAAAPLVISMVSAGASIAGQAAQQDAHGKYQQKVVDANEAQMQQNRDVATKAFLDQAYAANNQLAQMREQAAASKFDEERKALEARAATLAAAAAANVDGVSLGSMLQTYFMHEAMFNTRHDQNLIFKKQQSAVQIGSYRSEAEARILGVQPYTPAPLAPVDYVGPSLRIAESGLDVYTKLSRGTTKGTQYDPFDDDF
ncbi:MAG: hypothetical protein OEY86_04320 [Nitrospira sp.]|nr:hypothetical protein [Nitrospira sp.]